MSTHTTPSCEALRGTGHASTSHASTRAQGAGAGRQRNPGRQTHSLGGREAPGLKATQARALLRKGPRPNFRLGHRDRVDTWQKLKENK